MAVYSDRLAKFRIKAWSRFAVRCPFNATASPYNRRRSTLCRTVQRSMDPWHRPTNHGRSHPQNAHPSWQPALKITRTHPVSVIGRLTNLVCAAKPQRLNTSGCETPWCLPQPAGRLPSLLALRSTVSPSPMETTVMLQSSAVTTSPEEPNAPAKLHHLSTKGLPIVVVCYPLAFRKTMRRAEVGTKTRQLDD